MSSLSFDDLWKLLSDSDESVSIEAKTASELGKSIAETISAFSNEPHAGGGYLLLGVEKNGSSAISEYAIVGVLP
jgi:ATP-dependent DNA helicase RecG